MTAPRDLDPSVASLLEALRQAGLTIGMNEINRLRRVFELGPPPERLASVLGAILVKKPGDRDRFDRVLDAWLESAQDIEWRHDRRRHGLHALDDLRMPRPERPAAAPGSGVSARHAGLAASAGLALPLLALVALVSLIEPSESRESVADAAPPSDALVKEAGPGKTGLEDEETDEVIENKLKPSACAPATLRNHRFTVDVPVITATGSPPIWTGWWPLAMSFLASTLALITWLWLRNRHHIPKPEPLPRGSGTSRALLAPATLRGPALLDRRQQEAMVWGIGRFVSEQPTRKLDIPATIRATAHNAGIPDIHFERARHHREVWLWIDEDSNDPAIPRLADEIFRALRANGLPVERAVFRSIPERLVTPDGQEFAPGDLDERRHGAAVAILTEGELFADCYHHGSRRRIDSLLRDLSHWPQLAWVDFSPDPAPLLDIASKHGIAVIDPAAVAGYLAGTRSRASATVAPADHDIDTWAAACAVSPGPVAEETALELRRNLGLAVSPWALSQLRAHSPGTRGRLRWSMDQRIEHLQWLRESQADDRRAETLLIRAIAFWQARYQREDDARSQEKSWHDSPARQHLRMERALLDLWRQPAVAAAELHLLYQGPLAETIRHHLQRLCPADRPDSRCVRLLWQSTHEICPAVALAMLHEMGLGGRWAVASVARPGRFWLALAAFVGIALGSLAVAMGQWAEPPVKPLIIVDDDVPKDVWRVERELADDGWRITAVTPHAAAKRVVAPASVVTISRKTDRRPCVETRGAGILWRCGAEYKQPPPAPRRRVAIVDARADDNGQLPESAQNLAIALLDCNEADVVYFGSKHGWDSDRDAWFGEELVFILGIGAREIEQRLRALHRRGCGSGLMLAEIPGGTFTMGVETGDLDFEVADSDEKPARPVQLSDFTMSQCEVTNRQYRAYLAVKRPDAAGASGEPEPRLPEGDLDYPVYNVTWAQARAFCQHFGYDLPTEAQWEYACRAGTRGPWPLETTGESMTAVDGEVVPWNAEDLTKLSDYAWFDKSSGMGLKPAGTKEPTGTDKYKLYDMHGNLWEWVADWYGPYPDPASAEPAVDPKGPDESEAPIQNGLLVIDSEGRLVRDSEGNFLEVGAKARLSRGGSFAYRAWFLRCAYRYGFHPSFRDQDVGFRCVRGSRRQP